MGWAWSAYWVDFSTVTSGLQLSEYSLSKIKERIASIKISENTYRVIASNRLNYDFLQDITPCMEDAYIYLNQDD